MASKFLHDEGEEDSVVNDEWATSACMDVKDLNDLERHFLTALVDIHLSSIVVVVVVVVVVGLDRYQYSVSVSGRYQWYRSGIADT